jgi:hypothetical protein
MNTQRPRLTEQAAAEQARRRDREAEALRANLQRRKQQARLREAAAAPESAPSQGEKKPCR